ncbi:MAG: enoyl-CoA hydratase [Glaciihabitans sp.]|jgi:enoyl-CoA hydratase/carnithine racemase|nr:enoyl-CoA hydratase [Glaciihabitans sp.]
MTDLLAQFHISEPAEGYWRISFSNPPVNMLGTQTIVELQEIINRIEESETLRVVVFESAIEQFFLGRYDISGVGAGSQDLGTTGLSPFLDIATRLANSSVVSIALVRGRARRGGAELALACDMRFASIEKAIFGQPEVGAGFLPGGGAIERLPALVGRARALEIILSSNDFDAVTAEKYGWINQALPDADLDSFVDALARRLASFGGESLREAKRLVSRGLVPEIDQYRETFGALIESGGWPSTAKRRELLRERATLAGLDFEINLGHYLGPSDSLS